MSSIAESDPQQLGVAPNVETEPAVRDAKVSCAKFQYHRQVEDKEVCMKFLRDCCTWGSRDGEGVLGWGLEAGD